MSLTPRQNTKLRRLIKAHVEAQIQLSWIGSQMPEDHDWIEADAKVAEIELMTFIERLSA